MWHNIFPWGLWFHFKLESKSWCFTLKTSLSHLATNNNTSKQACFFRFPNRSKFLAFFYTLSLLMVMVVIGFTHLFYLNQLFIKNSDWLFSTFSCLFARFDLIMLKEYLIKHMRWKCLIFYFYVCYYRSTNYPRKLEEYF